MAIDIQRLSIPLVFHIFCFVFHFTSNSIRPCLLFCTSFSAHFFFHLLSPENNNKHHLLRSFAPIFTQIIRSLQCTQIRHQCFVLLLFCFCFIWKDCFCFDYLLCVCLCECLNGVNVFALNERSRSVFNGVNEKSTSCQKLDCLRKNYIEPRHEREISVPLSPCVCMFKNAPCTLRKIVHEMGKKRKKEGKEEEVMAVRVSIKRGKRKCGQNMGNRQSRTERACARVHFKWKFSTRSIYKCQMNHWVHEIRAKIEITIMYTQRIEMEIETNRKWKKKQKWKKRRNYQTAEKKRKKSEQTKANRNM